MMVWLDSFQIIHVLQTDDRRHIVPKADLNGRPKSGQLCKLQMCIFYMVEHNVYVIIYECFACVCVKILAGRNICSNL